ncbi:ABC transporter permease [Polyangium sorediatum]|uniref:FtsX-like permease family protein n=1 Tax=Polyangium sorediatum TaxID=889274 RepID=A0ABT6P644_9BACT|nr:FtsX-like permease family protein [Polyangium sorediatum]MDI1436077.1 FtsX-like permease family protein [Polyangium sorediatum]
MEAAPLPRSRSRLGPLLFLARKSLLGSRFTFALLVLSVAAGAGFQIPNTANLAGFSEALLEEELRHGGGDVRVEPREKRHFEDGAAAAARVSEAAGASVRAAVPVLVLPGAVGKGGRFQNALVYGYDFPGEPALRPFHLTSGALPAPGDTNGVLLGTSLANRLGVKVGDAVDLRIILGGPPGGAGEAVGGPPGGAGEAVGATVMTVRGLVSGSAGAYRSAFLDRASLAEKTGARAAASAIHVHLDDHFAASDLAPRLEARLPEARAVGWKEDDPYVTNYLAANRTINAVSYAMVVAAISIPVWALFHIHVLGRRREIGILAALGFSRREIFGLFLLQTLVVALAGLSAGAALGYGMLLYFDAYPIFSWEALVVRPVVTAAVLAGPCLAVLATTLLAGSVPAWRAARTDPARVLRRID